MSKEKRKIIIDTDLGDDVDDAAAIIMALHSPELHITGITTVYHNTNRRAEMVKELCSICGRTDIPVYAGYGQPLVERPEFEEYPIQYGILRQNYLVEQELDAVDFIIQEAEKNEHLTIVEMGAMTNLAMAFYKAPEIMKKVHIIAMGGIFSQSVPEWNMKCDPEAARIVMDYAKHLTMFGLEVTKHCYLDRKIIAHLKAQDSEVIDYFLAGVNIFQEQTGYPVTLHDALLIAWLLKPDIAELEKCDYTIELSGALTRGGIVLAGNAYEFTCDTKKDFYYAKSADMEKFISLVLERLL